MNKETLDQANDISALNHELERSMMRVLANQGQLLAKAMEYCEQTGTPAMQICKTAMGMAEGIGRTAEALKSAGIAHSRMHNHFNETADFPFICPDDEASASKTPALSVVNS